VGGGKPREKRRKKKEKKLDLTPYMGKSGLPSNIDAGTLLRHLVGRSQTV